MARDIETAGIPTVTWNLIREAAEKVGIPRSAFVAFPFGSPVGPPADSDKQVAVLRAALRLLEDTKAPGTIVELPFRWR